MVEAAQPGFETRCNRILKPEAAIRTWAVREPIVGG
jgi:hypothetical protein